MIQSNQPRGSGGFLCRLALLSPACLLAVAAVNMGGCVEHEREVRVYSEPPPPPPPVEETVVVEPAYTPPPPEVVTVYETDLNPYGHWVEIANYGRCWVPNHRPDGWRPYTYGHWVDSDQGWVWVSEDQDTDFGEVCYHYGRWYEDPSAGWVWVPGSVWGPSWVAWREGGGYCAWAPLPPQCVDGAVINVAVVNQYVPADRYYVVEEKYISEPQVYRRVIVNNVTIINKTKNITNITYVNNRVVARGVSVKNVEHYSGHPVERVQVARATTAEEARRLVANGKPAYYSPPAIEHYASEHPLRVIQPTRRTAGSPPVHADQKPAEPVRVDQERPVGPTPGQSQAERDAEAQRLRDQHANENVAHDQTPHADQKAAEDARLKALQEQKAAQDRAAADKAAADKAAHDKALQEKAAEDKAAHDKALQEKAAADKTLQEKAAAEKAQRDAEAEQLRNQKLAEQRAAQEKAAQEKAAADKAAADKAAAEKAAHDKPPQNKNGQKPDPNNPNNPNNGPR